MGTTDKISSKRPYVDQSGASQSLRYGVLQTFLYEAMFIVNSRPLTVESINDPTSVEPLTPNHLLTIKCKAALPPPGTFVKEDVYVRKRWALEGKHVLQEIRKRGISGNEAL